VLNPDRETSGNRGDRTGELIGGESSPGKNRLTGSFKSLITGMIGTHDNWRLSLTGGSGRRHDNIGLAIDWPLVALKDNLESRMLSEKGDNPAPKDLVIINNGNADG
jgi:hypothetical protein